MTDTAPQDCHCLHACYSIIRTKDRLWSPEWKGHYLLQGALPEDWVRFRNLEYM